MGSASVSNRLYKFATLDVARKVLNENRIKLSEFQDMNDPFELGGVSVGDNPALEDMIDHFRDTITALCLTTDWQHPLMWSHYADKYRGVCMGFDFLDSGSEAQRLQYVERIELIADDPKSLFADMQQAEAMVRRILLTKFKGWEYEHEVRILAKRDEMVNEMYFYTLNERLKLREFILGPRCDIDIPTLLKLKEENVAMHRAALSPIEFKVVLDEEGNAAKRLAKAIVAAERRQRRKNSTRQ